MCYDLVDVLSSTSDFPRLNLISGYYYKQKAIAVKSTYDFFYEINIRSSLSITVSPKVKWLSVTIVNRITTVTLHMFASVFIC